jgi:O-antigen biosynthesis protein
MRAVTALLYLLQPIARLVGRLRSGLTPWRRRGAAVFRWPWPRSLAIWSECWREDAQRLQRLEAAITALGAPVRRGGDFDRWDLEVHGGLLGRARLLVAVEQHPAGAQLIRLRWWPTCPAWGLASLLLLTGLAVGAALDRAVGVSTILGLGALSLAAGICRECGHAAAAFHLALERGAVEAVDGRARQV